MHRVGLLLPLILSGLLLLAHAASGAGSNVVVSQIYAGGGNSGASFTNDFVELFNRGSAAVDLSGWTIQYAPASSTTWQAAPLSGSIQPGRHYLVQFASSAAIGAALPTPEASGTANLAVSGGKVALVSSATALTCGATAGSCSANAAVEDLVGYGSAGDYEGSGPVPALSSTTAALRAGVGCTDTDANAADFASAAPVPRNASEPVVSCASAPPPVEGTSQPATVDIDIQPTLSIALERPTLSFGGAIAGDTPPAISERVTVVSNNTAGYTLTAQRSPFLPNDLPLGIAATAPAGALLGSSFAGGAVPIPVAPAAALILGTSTTRSANGGDVWPTTIGFTAPIPAVAAGHYTATITYTLIGR